MKTIEELADNHCSEMHNHNFKGEYTYEFTIEQLEQFAKAYMQDRLGALEPAAWYYAQREGNGIVSQKVKTTEPDKQLVAYGIIFEVQELHDISSLKEQ